jgi:hypothetical protein
VHDEVWRNGRDSHASTDTISTEVFLAQLRIHEELRVSRIIDSDG